MLRREKPWSRGRLGFCWRTSLGRPSWKSRTVLNCDLVKSLSRMTAPTLPLSCVFFRAPGSDTHCTVRRISDVSFIPRVTSLFVFVRCIAHRANFRYGQMAEMETQSQEKERERERVRGETRGPPHAERHACKFLFFCSSNTRLAEQLFSSSHLHRNGGRGTRIRCSAACRQQRRSANARMHSSFCWACGSVS